MHRLLIPILAIFLTSGCVILGSKDAYILVPDSEWGYSRQSVGNSYYYSCKGLRIDVEEIVAISKMSSFGPILPVFPSGNTRDYNNSNLLVLVGFVGELPPGALDTSKYDVVVNVGEQELRRIDRRDSIVSNRPYGKNGSNWVQFSVRSEYPIMLKELDTFTVQFSLPVDGCNIPALTVSKRHVDNNEIILSPGP